MTAESNETSLEPSLTPGEKILQLATSDGEGEAGNSVADVEVQAFIESLARIALAVARRGSQEAEPDIPEPDQGKTG